VAYLGGPLRLPIQLTIILCDGIFGHFTIFSSKTSKFRHSLTKRRRLSPDPLPGLCPWTPLRYFRPPDPLGPVLSHILNTPLTGSLPPGSVLCCAVPRYYRGTAVPFFYGTSTVGFTVLFSTAIPQLPRFFGTVLCDVDTQ